ncbi:phage portal protein, lambda family [Rhizobium sp. RU20A]|uniref:phage portal protein n=1 Tax=Rhizobium sp. RU20A TaxID=1907412 RepID=UPI0009570A76|nr:phage portal protein [Rhizobium sp. RU20A]SIQ57471.1 phage portal protein, lambda family [Rhizobium sp. RU20A]
MNHDPEIMELLGDAPSSGKPAPVRVRVNGAGAGEELSIAGDAYEGASRFSREMANYSPVIRSADADLLPAKATADARTRDTARNDAYVQGGATLRKDNIVGSYYMLNAKPVTTVLFGKEDEKWEDEWQEEVEEKFALWAESLDNWPDAARQNTLTGLVRMAVDTHTIHGEVLASAEWLRDQPRMFNTAIQMIDIDRLSTPPEFAGDPAVRGGVRRNKHGAPQTYYVRMAHPSDWMTPDSYLWKAIDIRKPWGRIQMMHIFEQLRPDQSRGISAMVAALSEMKMTKNFRQMVLQNAVLNATYAATVESELPTEAIFAQLGGSDVSPEKVQEMLMSYMGGHFNTLSQFMGAAKNLQIDGVKIPHLPPGSKFKLQGAGQGGPLGSEFEQSLLRHIAAALGVSYEQLSRDYTKTNYSSARAAMAETHKAMLSIKRMVADRFASHIYTLWLEEAINKGEITSVRRNMPSFYEKQFKDAYTACDWVGASRGQVDEKKETEAAILRIDNGLSDLETENARLGGDWRKRMRQIKREMGWKQFYGILQPEAKNQSNAASGTKKAA